MPKPKQEVELQSKQEKRPLYENIINDAIFNPDTPEGLRYPRFTIRSEGAVYLLYVKDGYDPGEDSGFWEEVFWTLTYQRPLREWARSKMLAYAINRAVGLPDEKRQGRRSPLERNAKILVAMDQLRRRKCTIVEAAEKLETFAAKGALYTSKGKPITASGILSAYAVARETFFVQRIPNIEAPRWRIPLHCFQTGKRPPFSQS